jgi:hypothetical protein
MPDDDDKTLTPDTTGKTFSEDYVKAIREEAKENRLARKAAEADALAVKAKFKDLLGLKAEEDIDDAKIAGYKTAQERAQTAALQQANARLLTAEIKSLEGYDKKLVERLLDRTKVKIAEDGTVTGLKEAVEALAAEFPLIKIQAAAPGAANPPGAGIMSDLETLKAAYNAAETRKDVVAMNSIMTQIKALKK